MKLQGVAVSMLLIACLLVVGSVVPVRAATTTWVGGSVGAWSVGSNWSLGVVPTVADDVVINTASTTVSTTAAISFKSLSVTGAGAVFNLNNAITAGGDLTIDAATFYQNTSLMNTLTGSLRLTNGAVLKSGMYHEVTYAYPYNPFAIRFSVHDVYQDATSLIDANYAGYAGGDGDGYGPKDGAGVNLFNHSFGLSNFHNGGGGANGGLGGAANVTARTCSGGSDCASTVTTCNAPDLSYAGSGGGQSGSDLGGETFVGGNGGGLVQISASENAILGGGIRADGQNALGVNRVVTLLGVTSNVSNGAGAGAGGTIRINAKTILGMGAGSFVARGGSSSLSGGGGGGGGGCVLFMTEVPLGFTPLSSSVTGGTGGTGAGAGGVGVITTLQRPLTPTSLTINLGITTGTLSWVSGGGSGTLYDVGVSTDGINFSPLTTTAGLTYNPTGLQPATTYWFRVASVSSTLATSSYIVDRKYTSAATTPAPTLFNPTSSTIDVQLNPGSNPTGDNFFIGLRATSSVPESFSYLSTGISNGDSLTSEYFRLNQWNGKIYGLTPSTTYSVFTQGAADKGNIGIDPAAFGSSATIVTKLAKPGRPTIIYTSTSSHTLDFDQNGNPATTPYALFNQTLGQYHLLDGSLSASPVFYRISQGLGKAKGLSPGTQYFFQLILRNEDGTQNDTSTAVSGYTLNSNGSSVSLGSSSSGGSSSGVISGLGATTTGSPSWYFATPTPSTSLASSPSMPSNGGGASSTVPVITLQSAFTGVSTSVLGNVLPIVTYTGKNESSRIIFSRFSPTINPFKLKKTLSFRYTFTNQNPTKKYRIERVVLSPSGKIINRSVVTRSIKQGQTVIYNPSQYFTGTLTTGLYTIRVRITSPDTKTIYDENSFDVSVKK